eukprot:COSAG02_NODE_2567_length_8517_cov_2.589570_6_plen_37_part_00
MFLPTHAMSRMTHAVFGTARSFDSGLMRSLGRVIHY